MYTNNERGADVRGKPFQLRFPLSRLLLGPGDERSADGRGSPAGQQSGPQQAIFTHITAEGQAGGIGVG